MAALGNTAGSRAPPPPLPAPAGHTRATSMLAPAGHRERRRLLPRTTHRICVDRYYATRPRRRRPVVRPASSRIAPAAAKLEVTSRLTCLTPIFEPSAL